jgi:hypothetical protein
LNKERVLVWEVPKDAKDKIDGFILYRKYTCPGQERPATAPQLVKALAEGFLIEPINEPVGCDAEYWVSAYGRAGESAPSNVVSAKTTSSVAIVTVSFNELKTDNPQSSSVTLLANEYYRVSSQMYMPSPFQLSQLPFDGMTGNNVIPVQLREDDSLTLGLKLTEWDFTVDPPTQKVTCDIEKTISPAKDGWEGLKATAVTLDSGKVPDCSVKVELNGRGPVKAGKEIRPEADVMVADLQAIGGDIYVRLHNNGPDRLPSNQVKLKLKLGKEKGKPNINEPAITRWWPPDKSQTMVKLYTIPASEDPVKLLKELFFTVEVAPVDFTDPDTSNNAKVDEQIVP